MTHIFIHIRLISFDRQLYRVSQRICVSPAHTKPFFWIHLLDVQGVGTCLFIECAFLMVLDFHS